MNTFLLLKELKSKEDKLKAKILSGFFKTGKGEYGEGDLFLGITVPESRKIAKKYSELTQKEIEILIKNKFHEARLVAILILVYQFNISKNDKIKKDIFNFYLLHTKYINNWDLVDLSASYIVGEYLLYQSKLRGTVLCSLAKSKNLWERRIAIVSTFAFIYKGEHEWTFTVVKILMKDKHDLIHKACGWMLREVGKRINNVILLKFLDEYSSQMPRTMLRSSIERLPENKRKYYLKKK